MSEAKVLRRGDPCPACGGVLVAAAVPTDEEFQRAFDRENPGALRVGSDTANPEQRADLGALFTCARCRYATRFPADAPAAAQ